MYSNFKSKNVFSDWYVTEDIVNTPNNGCNTDTTLFVNELITVWTITSL